MAIPEQPRPNPLPQPRPNPVPIPVPPGGRRKRHVGPPAPAKATRGTPDVCVSRKDTHVTKYPDVLLAYL